MTIDLIAIVFTNKNSFNQINAATLHFLTEVFKDPYCYDLLRWSPQRGEGENAFAIDSFGGGIH
jgi:hypothetical protein